MITPAYVQDTVFTMGNLLSALHRVLIQWREFALKGRMLDPDYVVIKMRETAAVLHEAANKIEADARKARAA